MEKQKEVQKEYEEYQYMLDTETWKKELSQFKLFSSEKYQKILKSQSLLLITIMHHILKR